MLVAEFLNVLNRSPISQTCHQHIWSPTSVANIDVTNLCILLKGIEADVTYLLNEVEKLKAEMEKQADHIQLLNSNAEAFRLNGEYEAQIRRFEQDNQDLTMKAAEMEQIHTELTRHNAELQAELDHKSGKLKIGFVSVMRGIYKSLLDLRQKYTSSKRYC